MFDLAIYQYLPNLSMQGEKGGDFLSELLKKYYLTLALIKALLIIEESKKNKKVGKTQLYQWFWPY